MIYTEALSDLRKTVLDTAVKMYNEKMCAGTSGNISAYDPQSGLVLITPSSYDYSIMQEKDIVAIDLAGNVVDGWLNPSSEWKMHVEIYKSLPHVQAVVHTHSPYATSFAVVRKEIPVILIEMIPFLKGSVEVSPFAAQGSPEVGAYAVPVLKRKSACLLANHGVVAVGETMGSAYLSAAYVEDAAKIYHMALSVGTPVVIEN